MRIHVIVRFVAITIAAFGSNSCLYGWDDASSNSSVAARGPIIVTARGRATPVSATPGGVGLLERGDFDKSGGVSISDFVSSVPGVSKSSDGAWGADFNIRGLARDSVVFLIDGTRVNTATDIGARFGMIDPMEIERVEILKGPISSLYGSGSLGGVVNVITRTGSFAATNTLSGGFSAMISDNPEGYNSFTFASISSTSTYMYFSQTYRDHESYKDGSGKEVRNSQFTDSESKFRFGQKIGGFDVFEANIQYFEGHNIGIPGSGTAPLPSAADVTYRNAERGMFDIAYTTTPEGRYFRKSSLDVYYQYINRLVTIDNFPAASAVRAVKPEGRNETYGSKWLNIIDVSGHEISAGLDVWQRAYDGTRSKYLASGKVVQDKPLPDAEFTSCGMFAEDDWKLSKTFIVNAGARIDVINVRNDATGVWPEDSSTDNSWNAHAGGTWKLVDKLNMKLIGASGYRAASLEERFQVLDLGGGVTKYGDPGLKPERTLFAEYGIQWLGDVLFLELSVFVNNLDNMIGEEIVDSTRVVNGNIDKARIQGVELQGRYHLLNNIDVYGNISYLSGRNTGTDEYLPGIAPLSGLAGVSIGEKTGPWAKLESAFAARQDKVPGGVSEAAGWATVNARIGWNFKGLQASQSVYLGANNLFDKNYRNYLTTYRGNIFNEPGRSVFAGYELSF